jgi:hypothetical protein
MEDETSFEYLYKESMRLILNPIVDEGTCYYEYYKAMRNDYLTIRDKTTSDRENLRRLMKDWIDYCEALLNVSYNDDLEKCSTNNEESQNYREMQEKEIIKTEEIEKKFINILGDASETIKIRHILKS